MKLRVVEEVGLDSSCTTPPSAFTAKEPFSSCGKLTLVEDCLLEATQARDRIRDLRCARQASRRGVRVPKVDLALGTSATKVSVGAVRAFKRRELTIGDPSFCTFSMKPRFSKISSVLEFSPSACPLSSLALRLSKHRTVRP